MFYKHNGENLLNSSNTNSISLSSNPMYNFLAVNVCGLNSKLKYRNIHEIVCNHDFICLCEIRTPFIPYDEFPGYDAIISNRKCKKNGIETDTLTGLAILIKTCDKFSFQIIEAKKTNCEWILWVKVCDLKNEFSFLLGSTYIPCETSSYYSDNIYETIVEDVLDLTTEYQLPFILMGDFNSRCGNLSDTVIYEKEITSITGFSDEDSNYIEQLGLLQRKSEDGVVNRNGKDLITFCKSFNLKILNGRFGSDKGVGMYTCHTPRGESVVDYALVSDCLIPQVKNFLVDPLDTTLSDVHSAIHVSLSNCSSTPLRSEQLGTEQPEATNSNNLQGDSRPTYRDKWKPDIGDTFSHSFNEDNVDHLLDTLVNMNNNEITQENIDSVTNEMVDIFIEAAQSTGLCKENKNTKPYKKRPYSRRHPQQDWFDEECESKRKAYMETKNAGYGKKSKQARKAHREILKHVEKEYKNFIAKTQNNFRINIAKVLKEAKSKDPKCFWKILKSKNSQSKKDGNISLQSFMQHFQELNNLTSEQSDSEFKKEDLSQGNNEELNRDFNVDEIEKLIKKLKTGKSCGIDNIINEYLKKCPTSMKNAIVSLFNLVLKSGIVPSDWCIGIIIPLFKNKGDINDVNNYRGITLLSVLGKLFTSAINQRLTKFLEGISALGEDQAGFREGYSTLNHIFVLHCIIDFYLQKKKRLYCAFIDYSKAFDLINRSTLWIKLLGIGVKGKIINVIYNLYDSAKSCVRKCNNLSDFFHCNVGVRQGENLSPLLFAIYLNDFESFVAQEYEGLTFLSSEASRLLGDDVFEMYLRLYILLYADDTIVLAESPNQLQAALNSVQRYCEKNSLKLNLTKTKVIVFSRGKIRNIPKFWYGEEQVEVVDDYIYLGVKINYNGSFTKAIEKQIDQARKAMFSLITKARRLQLPVDLQIELFDKTVVPILLYGCEVWGCSNISEIEVFYRKFLKIVLKVGKSTPNCMVYGETGKFPLQLTIFTRIVNFWVKISEDKNKKIATKFYKIMFNLQKAGHFDFKWLNQVKTILVTTGYSNLWEMQDQYNTKYRIAKNIPTAIKESIVSVCHDKIQTGSRCNSYKIFKQNLNFEYYLTNLSTRHRITMSKFRCGHNRLPVNDFRFFRTEDLSLKNCKLCDRKESGDEFHYLFVCPYFFNDRKKYLNECFIKHPNTEKMYKLFNSRDKKTLVNLAKFQAVIMSKF